MYQDWKRTTLLGQDKLITSYLLLHRQVMTPASLAFFMTAIALHLVVRVYGLDTITTRLTGRLVAGCSGPAGLVTELPEAGVAELTAFLCDGVVLNVLK